MELPGLNFRPGLGVQAVIKQRFGLPVTPTLGSRAFFLVASFGRYRFHLCNLSVALILQATIGGSPSDFDIVQLGPRVFRFSVSSKPVGFHVFKLGNFECSAYKIFFHLWGHGGPRWDLEFAAFNKEEATSWSMVKNNKKASYAEVVQKDVLTGANAIPLRKSAFDRLVFPNSSIGQHQRSPVLRNPPKNSAIPGSNSVQFGKQGSSSSEDFFNLNLSLRTSQPSPTQYLSKDPGSRICARCLSDKHTRKDCKNPIRCHNCTRWGHTAVNCWSHRGTGSNSKGVSSHSKEKVSLGQPTWFTRIGSCPLGLEQAAHRISPPSQISGWPVRLSKQLLRCPNQFLFPGNRRKGH